MSEGADGDQEFAAGEVVHDRDDDEPNDAVVVNVPPLPASEWDVRALDKTLAEANLDYPADAQTVIVVFCETLAEYFETTDTTGELESQLPIAALANEQVQFYAFPAPRLEATGERYTHNSESEAAAEPTAKEQDDSDAASVGPLPPRLVRRVPSRVRPRVTLLGSTRSPSGWRAAGCGLSTVTRRKEH